MFWREWFKNLHTLIPFLGIQHLCHGKECLTHVIQFRYQEPSKIDSLLRERKKEKELHGEFYTRVPLGKIVGSPRTKKLEESLNSSFQSEEYEQTGRTYMNYVATLAISPRKNELTDLASMKVKMATRKQLELRTMSLRGRK
eukprot:TRINITY_DN2651_c0_g1_i10.p1 TRINITY_DN2651_c0_g1~~TRINITY_DN2651_c0_g1_i10.p1  ORF type:complete len:142 (-),score=16.99 TRINITY_DN2651_c0_g1_i10:41-466(-)